MIRDLQREQFNHDERFHRDIARLNVHARLNHMALHFCKYAGQFATVCTSANDTLRCRTITDSFIISLCASNSLSLDLSEQVTPNPVSAGSLRDLGFALGKQLYPDARLDDGWLLLTHTIQAGRMARACEKIDHLEAFPFREECQDAVIKLCQVALIAASVNDIDLMLSVQKRRCDMRQRTSFTSLLCNNKD